MGYTCEHCGKDFNTNHGLYDHKEKFHKSPTVVLVNHQDHQPSSSRKIPTPNNVQIPSSDEDSDEMQSSDSEISTDLPPYRKRKADGSDGGEVKKRKILPPSNDSDYKRLYLKCLRESKKLKSAKKILEQQIKKLEQDREVELEQHHRRVEQLNLEHREYTLGIENAYRENLDKLREEHREEIQKLQSDCDQKIKNLNNYIKDLKEDEYANFNELSKIIYNCVTIEEIHRIRELINTQRIDDLLTNHIDTLQNIMLGLSVGVIPVCNPQRSVISEEQQKLIQDIQDVSPATAKRQIRNNRGDFTKLWSIVDDSLQLICQTYNRYGSRDEDGTA